MSRLVQEARKIPDEIQEMDRGLRGEGDEEMPGKARERERFERNEASYQER